VRFAFPRSFCLLAAVTASTLVAASCGSSGGSAAAPVDHAPAPAAPEVTKAQLDALTMRVLELELDVANLRAAQGPSEEPMKPPADDPTAAGGSESATVTCATGKEQSPIELGAEDALAADIANPVIGPMPASTATVDPNAPDLRLLVAGGQTMTLEGVVYTLQSIEVRSPSEHTIKGAQSPLELQMVHADAVGRIAIVAVMVNDGVESGAVQALVDVLDHGDVTSDVALATTFDPSGLLPAALTSYRYLGSLTSSPCTEGVSWVVLETPITASAAQIETIASHVPPDTTRVTQPRGDRIVGLDITP